jgi:hypothetical protein
MNIGEMKKSTAMEMLLLVALIKMKIRTILLKRKEN